MKTYTDARSALMRAVLFVAKPQRVESSSSSFFLLRTVGWFRVVALSRRHFNFSSFYAPLAIRYAVQAGQATGQDISVCPPRSFFSIFLFSHLDPLRPRALGRKCDAKIRFHVYKFHRVSGVLATLEVPEHRRQNSIIPNSDTRISITFLYS